MPSITITLFDLPNGQGAVAVTDGTPPAIGRTVTPAESLATDLLRLCKAQASEVRYGAEHVPSIHLAREMLHPEGYAHACNPELRDAARRALGMPAVETLTRRAA